MTIDPNTTTRRLAKHEHVDCAHCGTPRHGNGGDKVTECGGRVYCDDVCAKAHVQDT